MGQLQEAGQVALNLLHAGALTQDEPVEMEEQGLEQERVLSRRKLLRSAPI